MKFIDFGEKVEGYNVKVFNEREVRAAAGIMLLFAATAFFNAFLLGEFTLIRIFVVIFFADFFLRVVINPRFSPSMILGRLIVRKQKPEYAGAPQKRFAWGLGLLLAITMIFLVVINNITGPLNLAICMACLTFLYFESVFGICIGCKMYNIFTKKKAQHCPGGVCEIKRKEDVQKVSLVQIGVLVLFIGLTFLLPVVIN